MLQRRDPIAVMMRESGKTRLQVLEEILEGLERNAPNLKIDNANTVRQALLSAIEKERQNTIDKDAILKAARKGGRGVAGRHSTKEGRIVLGLIVSDIAQALRYDGWKNVPRFDASDLRKLGVEVISAQYISGAHPTGRFVDTVVIEER